jgi:hypothetical protein
MTKILRHTVRENRVFDKICTFSPRRSSSHPKLCRPIDSLEWPRSLRRGSAASLLLGLRVRFPVGAWKFVSRKCCVL